MRCRLACEWRLPKVVSLFVTQLLITLFRNSPSCASFGCNNGPMEGLSTRLKFFAN